MKTTKHFALVALFVLGAMLGASTPVQGQYNAPYGPLHCVVGEADPDFGASGQWAFSIDWRSGFAGATDGRGNYFRYYQGTAGVQCSGLNPGAWYSVDFYSAGGSSKRFKAGKKGSAEIGLRDAGLMYAYGPDYGDGGFFVWVQVARLNPDGTSTVVLTSE